MVHKWTVTTFVTGTERQVEFVLYDTEKAMRSAAVRYARRIGESDPDFSEAAAICHGFRLYSIHADGSETLDPLVSVVRLSRPYLTTLVLSHEVAHAAQHIYAIDHVGEKDLALEHFHSGNEEFAHLCGELFSAIWGRVREGVLDG